MVKLTKRYSKNANKLWGYEFNGKKYKTKLTLNSAMSRYLKRNPKKRQTPPAKPLYKVK